MTHTSTNKTVLKPIFAIYTAKHTICTRAVEKITSLSYDDFTNFAALSVAGRSVCSLYSETKMTDAENDR